MAALFDQDRYLGVQTEAERATDYPYIAPEGGFVLDHGVLRQLDDPALLAGRTAVLSVGSNRAPVQLRRKFGDAAMLPVTPAILHDCDIVHAATISYYGAVSCTAHPSVGTDVMLNIAWLDPDQLRIMHRTEALGIAYDYVRLFAGVVTHLPVIEAGGDIVAPAAPVFGYSARSGVLDVGGGWPAGLARIPARGRKFQTLSQGSAAGIVHAVAGESDSTTPAAQADFIERVVGDKVWRQEINSHLQSRAIHADGPWQVQPVTSDDVEAFL
ncbi:MAG: hypothetical protein ACON31_11265 [Candidatus Puniceispirillaceae bacterium]